MRALRLSALAQKSIADVARRKLRSVLVVVGIAVGVAGLCAINLSSRAIVAAQAYLASSAKDADVQINTAGIDPAALAQLRALPNVRSAELASVYLGLWQIHAAPGQVNLRVTAYPDLASVSVQPFELTSGRLPGAGEIVMDSTDRGYQDFELGDSITLLTSNGSVPLTVVGTARAMGQGSASLVGTARGYMSAAALAATARVQRPTLALLQVRDATKTAATAQAAEARLRKGGATLLGTTLGAGGLADKEIKGLYTVMNTLSVAALLLAALLIANTIATLVSEQQQSMGVMKALGGTRRAVVRGYLLTVGIYAVAGTVLGLLVGIAGGGWLTQVLANAIVLDPGKFHLNLGVLATGAGLGLVVPVLAAMGPVWWGTKATVRDALNGHVHGPGSAPALPAWLSGLSHVPRTLWLGLAGAFRRPVRAAMTLAALAFAASTFLAIQTAGYSFDRYVENLSGQFQADVFVNSNQPRDISYFRSGLSTIPNVAQVEAFNTVPVNTQWGPVILEGAQQTPALYQLQLLKGSWVRPGQQNALLVNEQLRDKSGVDVGGTITLSTPTRSESWTVVGVARDLNTGLGTAGVALTTINTLNAFEGLPAGSTLGLMIATKDRSEAAVAQAASDIEGGMLHAGLNASVRTASDNIKRTRRQFGVLRLLLESVAAIVGLIGILGLSSTLATSVLERRREMGTLRAMGASSRRVASVFLCEGLTLAVLAVVVAAALGLPLAYGFVHLIDSVLVDFGFAFNPIALVTMALVTVAVALAASVAPALGAGRLRVADCLRYE